MPAGENPADAMFLDEMICEPIDDFGIKIKSTNEESPIFGSGGKSKDNFSFLGTDNVGMDLIYGIVIIGFIYSVGDYIFNGMPKGIVAQKLQNA
jgi:hypothetical protein